MSGRCGPPRPAADGFPRRLPIDDRELCATIKSREAGGNDDRTQDDDRSQHKCRLRSGRRGDGQRLTAQMAGARTERSYPVPCPAYDRRPLTERRRDRIAVRMQLAVRTCHSGHDRRSSAPEAFVGVQRVSGAKAIPTKCASGACAFSARSDSLLGRGRCRQDRRRSAQNLRRTVPKT
jgi:hypothetical protein